MGWFETVEGVLTKPNEFFSKMPKAGGLGEPLIFFSINNAVLGILFGVMVAFIFSLIGALLGPLGTILGVGVGAIAVVYFFVAAVVGGLILLFVWSGVMHVIMKILGGTGSYEGTVRVYCYASATNLFLWIPVLNILVLLYTIYLQTVGLSYVHGISKGKTLIGILIPAVIVGLILILVFSPVAAPARYPPL